MKRLNLAWYVLALVLFLIGLFALEALSQYTTRNFIG